MLTEMKYMIMFQLLFWFSYWQVYGIKQPSIFYPMHKPYLRQGSKSQQIADEDLKYVQTPKSAIGPQEDQKDAAAGRFSTWATKTKKKKTRTTPEGQTLEQHCDYIMKNCFHGYKTGKLCARTVYYEYRPFENYCTLDYVNCREGYEIWQVVHMGACFEVPLMKEYIHYVYHDDWFLDNYYILEDY